MIALCAKQFTFFYKFLFLVSLRELAAICTSKTSGHQGRLTTCANNNCKLSYHMFNHRINALKLLKDTSEHVQVYSQLVPKVNLTLAITLTLTPAPILTLALTLTCSNEITWGRIDRHPIFRQCKALWDSNMDVIDNAGSNKIVEIVQNVIYSWSIFYTLKIQGLSHKCIALSLQRPLNLATDDMNETSL